MICGVVATSISGCVLCVVLRATAVAYYMARSTHITAWNTCCHNAACHITMYFHLSFP